MSAPAGGNLLSIGDLRVAFRLGKEQGVVRRIEEEMGQVRLLATGGLAAAIVPFTETIDEVDEMLTLKGLRLIHVRNS